MRGAITFIAILGIAAGLTACNSTDALTPQVDVGGGTFNSPPVNQRDLDSMQTVDVAPQRTAPVESTQLSSPSQQAYSYGTSDTEFSQGDTEYTNPAGSFEAQAQRLQQGEALAQSQHSAREPIAADETPIEQQAPSRHLAEVAPAAETQDAVEPPQKQAAIAPAATANSIRFLPIIGAPVDAVTPLSRQLGSEARSHGLTIKAAADTSSQHILKGYFSAFKDGNKTTVVYVWDVLDGSGSRLHRIQGQESVASAGADLWSGVPAGTMQSIASKTIAQYLEWRDSDAG